MNQKAEHNKAPINTEFPDGFVPQRVAETTRGKNNQG